MTNIGDNPQARLKQALAHLADGAAVEAEAELRALMAAFPGSAPLLVALARALRLQNRDDEAEAALRTAILTDATSADAHNNLGNLLRKRGATQEALACFQAALKLRSDDPVIRMNLQAAFLALERHEDAAAAAETWIAAEPNEARAFAALADALTGLKRHAAAAAAAERAAALSPNEAIAWSALSRALDPLGDPHGALNASAKSMALDPTDKMALIAHTQALASCHLAEDAWATAQVLNARHPGWEAQNAIARSGFFSGPDSGRMMAAWAAYESRFERPDLKLPPVPRPRFEGGAAAGQRLLLLGEQGLGDCIMFARAAWDFAALGAEVLLHLPAPLKPLFTALPAGVRFAEKVDIKGVDAWAPLLSAPLALGRPILEMPGPYITAPPGRTAAAAVAGPGLKVGLVWAGNPKFSTDHLRSIPLPQMLQLTGLAGIRFFSLQVGPGVADIQTHGAGALITDLSPTIQDWGDTAASLAALDLLITIDSAPAHLAGAMGRPVWMLTPFTPDWRWGLHAPTTPWYPSMRLYRQSRPRDWETPLKTIAADLAALAGGTSR